MDSNVSKNTNSHNFFKLRVNRQKLNISVQDLLAKELLSCLTLYRYQHNVKIEHSRLATIIKQKTVISNYKNNITMLPEKGTSSISTNGKLMPIVYGCPLGLSLAIALQQSPATIVERLGNLLSLKQENNDRDYEFELPTEILTSGWINFYLDANFIASWLNKLFNLSQTASRQQLAQTKILSVDPTQVRLFSAQYLHARCCSLLALGMREKLLVLNSNSHCLKYPESIAWLDGQNLCLRTSAEYNLLRQLLIVTDAWVRDSDYAPRTLRDRQWTKLALNLTQATDIFLAECRFLGEIKAKNPQLAIARLGLIALVQFWLERILQTKLNMAAPQEM